MEAGDWLVQSSRKSVRVNRGDGRRGEKEDTLGIALSGCLSTWMRGKDNSKILT